MTANHLFFSYKRQEVTADIARAFYNYLYAVKGGMGDYTMFMDEDMNAGQELSASIRAELEKTTHFICFLTTAYWVSKECRKELFFALKRFRATGSPRLLFIKVEDIDPKWLRFDNLTGDPLLNAEGLDLDDDESDVESVGDIIFLGPYKNSRLVRLMSDTPVDMTPQFYQLAMRLQAVL